jgi:hypothetical protein
LNGSYSIPTTFHGQNEEIKNCGLGKFAIHAFLPMTRLETSVSYAGTAVNLKDLASKSADLKGWIDDKLAGKENDKKPADLAKELGKLTKQATTVSPILRLKPIFADKLDGSAIVYAKCNNCENPSNTSDAPIASDGLQEAESIPPDACRTRCSAQYDAWIAAARAEAEKRKLHDDTEIGRSITAVQSELNSLKTGVNNDQNRLRQAEAKVKGFQDEAARKGFDLRELGDIWSNALNARETAQLELEKTQARLKMKEKQLADLKKKDATSQARIDRLAKETSAAKAAYGECAKRCRDTAATPKPKPVQLPRNARMDPCLIGQWVSEYFEELNGEWRGSGVLLSFDGTGRMTVDYSQMRPICLSGDCSKNRIWYTGQASTQIMFVNGNIWPGPRQSSVTEYIAHGGSVTDNLRTDGGPAFLGGDTSYSCDAIALTTTRGTESASKKLFKRR